MFHVKAKETTVTIGERVFSPTVDTCFQDELPPEVAERSDLLTIEEVPDAEPTVDAGGLAATGTLQAGASAPSEAGTGADGEPDGQDLALDPQTLTDEALTSGVTIIDVGDDAGESIQAPDPFADPAEAPAPKAQPSGRGGRGGRK
jgi:hypothetical protein